MSARAKGFWGNPDVIGPREQAIERALDRQSRTALRRSGVMLKGRSSGTSPARNETADGGNSAKSDPQPQN